MRRKMKEYNRVNAVLSSNENFVHKYLKTWKRLMYKRMSFYDSLHIINIIYMSRTLILE